MSKQRPEEYVESGKHLPPFLRDFHDQKEVFKTIHFLYSCLGSNERMPDWTSAHCYVIDWFLWYMGQRGYTLQKSRADVEFRSIEEDIERRRKAEADNLRAFLAGHSKGEA